MGNRCSSCNKFVSLDPAEPEVDLDINNEGNITGTVRLVLACAECGDELKEYNFDVDESASDKIEEHILAHQASEELFSLEIESDIGENEDHFENTDKNTGKPIPFRFQKHFYGYLVGATITCTLPECKDWEANVEIKDNAQASSFDDI
jgi:hypothetical protein